MKKDIAGTSDTALAVGGTGAGSAGLRELAVLVLALVPTLLLTSCTPEGPEESIPPGQEGESSPSYVSFIWVERQLMVATLDRMFIENGGEEVMDNIDEDSKKILEDARIIRQGEDGHHVESNENEWWPGTAPSLNQLDQALYNSLYPNEITWCEEVVNGEDFVDSYTKKFQQAFDTVEEYELSISDYVDCGTGEL